MSNNNTINNPLDKLTAFNCIRISYGCQLLGLLSVWIYGFVLFPILALILNFLKVNAFKKKPFLKSHFNYQVMTVFAWIVAQLLGKVLAILLIGFFLILGADIWLIYRAIKGWLALSEDKTPSQYKLSFKSNSDAEKSEK